MIFMSLFYAFFPELNFDHLPFCNRTSQAVEINQGVSMWIAILRRNCLPRGSASVTSSFLCSFCLCRNQDIFNFWTNYGLQVAPLSLELVAAFFPYFKQVEKP